MTLFPTVFESEGVVAKTTPDLSFIQCLYIRSSPYQYSRGHRSAGAPKERFNERKKGLNAGKNKDVKKFF